MEPGGLFFFFFLFWYNEKELIKEKEKNEIIDSELSFNLFNS